MEKWSAGVLVHSAFRTLLHHSFSPSLHFSFPHPGHVAQQQRHGVESAASAGANPAVITISSSKLRKRSSRLLTGRVGRTSLRAHQHFAAVRTEILRRSFGRADALQHLAAGSSPAELHGAIRVVHLSVQLSPQSILAHDASFPFRGSETGVTSIPTRQVAGSNPARPKTGR